MALKPKEVAEALRLPVAVVNRLIETKVIPSARYGGVVMVPVAALRRWLESVTEPDCP